MSIKLHKPADFLRLLAGAALMAFALTAFLLSTYVVVLPLASFFVPAIVDSLPHFLDDLTSWTGINIGRESELFATLLARFVLIGTLAMTLIFLLRPPAKLIERGVAGDFKTSKVISLKWYGRVIVGCLLFGFLFGFLHAGSNNAGTYSGPFFALIVGSGLTTILAFFHGFLLFFLLGFWNLGCELVYPFLSLDK